MGIVAVKVTCHAADESPIVAMVQPLAAASQDAMAPPEPSDIQAATRAGAIAWMLKPLRRWWSAVATPTDADEKQFLLEI
jgi:hypothetical protein